MQCGVGCNIFISCLMALLANSNEQHIQINCGKGGTSSERHSSVGEGGSATRLLSSNGHSWSNNF